MAQVSVTDVLSGLKTIADAYFTATYGASSVVVHQRKPTSHTYAKLKELLATGSLQTLVFFWSEIVPGEWVTTPGSSIKEDWTIHAEVFRGYIDTDAAVTSFIIFFENFRGAALAQNTNIRAGQSAGIRVGPWQLADLGTSNKGTFCNYGHLTAYFNNQPRST